MIAEFHLVLNRFSFTYKLIKDLWQKDSNEMYTQETFLEFSPHSSDLRVSTEYFWIKLPLFAFKIVDEIAYAILSPLNCLVTFIKRRHF